MSQRRVIAFTLHEHEVSTAHSALANTVSTDGYVVGDADQATIDALTAQGLVVRELPGKAGKVRRPAQVASLRDGQTDYVVLELREPLHPTYRSGLEGAGLFPVERLDELEFLCRVDDGSAVTFARSQPYVRDVTAYEEGGGAAPAPTDGDRASPAARGDTDEERAYDVLLRTPDFLQDVEALATQQGALVTHTGTHKLRLSATPEQAEAINRHPGVALVEEYVVPKLYNERARALVWPDAPAPGTVTGRGQVIAVADSGLDETHPAFAGRVRRAFAWGRPEDSTDPHGHGTHVAGTALGAGDHHRGMAPEAELVFQSVMDASGALGGLPVELGELLEQAYDAGARIHSNSWGADLESSYTVSSLEVDRYVCERPDMLVVIAAGNAGRGARGDRNAQRGFVEWGSIAAPATSKNALVVGASRSDRPEGGLAPSTYSQIWHASFPDPPIANEPVSGNPEALAAFSARGPCTDRRIKPDVVAPGTDILSAKAETAPSRNFSRVVAADGVAYGYMSGTSMATPVVAGLAALVRQYLAEARQLAEPSSALLKALLINGTRMLSAVDALADHPQLPNFHQGFGAVHLPTTIPLDGSFQLAFVDNWNTTQGQLQHTQTRQRFMFTTTGEAELRVTLVHTDPPGRGVQNDLALVLELPDGSKRLGNEHVPLSIFRPDPDNNVETLRIEGAPAGTYMVAVVATVILHAPQGFALVVTGALADDALVPR